MKNYTFAAKFNNFKYASLYYFKKNKVKIFLLIFIFIFALLTGIFTVTKYLGKGTLSKDFLLSDYLDNDFGEFSSLMTRFLSAGFIIVIISLCSLSVIIVPIGLIVWAYRAYLIGYNCTILIICYGFNGILTALIAILPCQILLSLIFLIYFSIMLSKLKEKKNKCCFSFCISIPKFVLIFAIIIFIVCILEYLLLLLFNANVILVI